MKQVDNAARLGENESGQASTFWDMGRKTPSSHYSELLVVFSYKLVIS